MSSQRCLVAAVSLAASLVIGAHNAVACAVHLVAPDVIGTLSSRKSIHSAAVVAVHHSSSPPISAHARRLSVCSLFGSGDITPCNEVGNLSTGAQTKNFTVTNNHTSSVNFTVSASCSGTVTACSITPTSFTIAAHGTHLFTSHFTMATGSGHLVIAYESGLDDEGQSDNTYSTIVKSVAVAPKGQAVNAAGVTTNSQSFTVTNTGAASEAFALSTICSGSATSCIITTPTTVTLASGADTLVSASYTAGAVGTTGTIKLIAKDGTNASPADTGSANETSVLTVNATPDNQVVNPVTSGTIAQIFTLQNNRPVSTTYTLSAVCGGVASSCSVAASKTLPAQSAAPETVSYHTSATSGSGRVSLYAVQSGDANNKDSAWVLPASLPGGTPAVVIDSVNAGKVSERDLCLDFGLGSSAASECGDLRLVYALPTVRTRAKSRTPTLLYNSQFAYPYQLIAANVTMPSGTAVPDSVTAVLKLNGVARGTGGTWSGSDWGTTGSTRRIVVGYSGLADSTNIYSYSLEVSNWYASTKNTQTMTGQVIVVNRATSRFGVGWWIAGLERLKVDSMLWVGGDGSARKYSLVATNVWAAPAIDRPDTLKWNGSRYVRYLPHGLTTLFDASGRHVATVNRLGDSTRFTYDASSRLDSIVVPGGPFYKFFYSATSGLLDSVTAPGPGSTRRSVAVTRNADGTIAKLRDAQLTVGDTTGVRFGFVSGDTNRVRSRTDRRGTVVSYSYDSGKKVTQGSLNMGAQPAIVTSIRPSETIGLRGSSFAAARSLDSTYTRFTGSRTDLTAITKFWIDRFGEPTRIVNAIGDSTLLARTDARWPSLVTQETARNAHVVRAYFNTRGNEDSTVDVNPFGTGANAVTKFVWDPKWDFVIRITQPVGEVRQTAYDASNGNRLWEQPGTDTTDHSHRVTYGYDATTKLMRSIKRPVASHADSLFYDGLGNLSQSKSAMSFRTFYYADTLGRDTLVKSPTDAAQTQFTTIATTYDAWDRIVSTRTTGAATSPAATPTKTLAVQNYYNRESRLDSLWRWTIPNTLVDTIRSAWRYDPALRTVAEVAADGKVDSLWYDPAGNQVGHKSRRAQTITTSYDALNRVTARASDNSQSFTYDKSDNMLTANNNDAHIARTYYPNGEIATDTLHIRTWTGADFIKHVYPLTYTYDLDGRKRRLDHPRGLDDHQDSTVYSFDTLLGTLASVRDPLGTTLHYHYDGEARIDSVSYSTNTYAKNVYDDDGRLTRRIEWGPSAHSLNRQGASTDTLHDDWLTYDARGKVLIASTEIDSSTIAYDGLGAVASRILRPRPFSGPTPTEEYILTDALGQQDSSVTNDGAMAQYFHYDRHTGRMTRADAFGGAPAEGHSYDASGNDSAASRIWNPPSYSSCGGPTIDGYSRWYSFDQHMDSVQKTSSADPACVRPIYFGSFDHFRYDALGRRVLTRSYGTQTTSNSIERYVWDGSDLLWETHYPGAVGTADSVLELDTLAMMQKLSCEEVHPHDCGWDYGDTLFMQLPDSTPYVGGIGRIVHTHGAQMDQPMSMIRFGYASDSVLIPPFAVMPHHDYRGLPDIGTFSSGNTAYTYFGLLVNIDYFAPQSTLHMQRMVSSTPHGWFGGLLSQQQTPAGDMYMRNRYYDPMQGRFTQEDPIGLAGGMNLYGFAGGDPINFSDPFGLCPKDAGGDGKTEEFKDCEEGASGYYANKVAKGEGTVVNTILGVGASCGESTGCEVAAVALGGEAIGMVAGAGEALGLNQYLRAGMRTFRGEREFRIAGKALDWITGKEGTHWTSTKVLNAIKDLMK